MKILGKENPAIIAEIGVNHEGDVDCALKLMKLAAEAGASIVKFQSYTPERYVAANQKERLDRVKKFALTFNDFEILNEEANKLGVEFLSSPLSEDWVDKLNNMCSAFKIASGDIDFKTLIEKIAYTGKPMILSTGGATVDEIDQTLKWIGDIVPTTEMREKVILMHCVSAYPTPVEQANILTIPYLRERFDLKVGYSNHVIGGNASLAAVALGADIIEVHFTDNKSEREFHDHKLSFDYHDLKNFIFNANEIKKSLGRSGCYVQDCERSAVPLMRKGLVASRDLKKGDIIMSNDLMFARPATEFKAFEKDLIIGKVLTENIAEGFTIKKDYIK